MSMWPDWNKEKTKTRLIHANGEAKPKIEDDYEYEYTEEKVRELLKAKDDEINGLRKRLDENTKFLQDIIIELIKLKMSEPSYSSPKTQLEKYIAKKNSQAT